MRTGLLFAAAALALSACTVGPDYHGPAPVASSPNWVEPAAAGAVDTRWWQGFGDPVLSDLVTRALAKSPDLKEAGARLAEARANLDAARGGRLPTVTAKGSATENRYSENGALPVGNIPGFPLEYSLFDLGFDASWELDFWGRHTREIQGAVARVGSAEEARHDVVMTLISEIARNYVELRGAQADAATARANAAAAADLARLTALRFRQGEAARQDADSAESAARAAAAAVPQAEANAAGSAYRIAVLVGEPPEQVVPALLAGAPIPAGPDAVAAGLRSELLERRPDVRKAERELAAATADIGVATADLFPRFSLLGSIGMQAQAVGDLVDSGSIRYQVGPSFSWPIFAGGTIRAHIRATDARADAAAARYEKAVLGALSDSEAAINRFAHAGTTLKAAEDALARQRGAYAMIQARTARGEDDRLTLARAQQAVVSAEQARDRAAAAKCEAAVALYKALGGGWDVAETTAQ